MLRPRIIPCLLIKKGGLVKTVQFDKPKYVGDPLNAVRIFNDKAVDELIVVDIDATAQKLEPNYEVIKNLAAECRMPLCYGGGVKKVEQVERIISLGVEKVAVSSAGISDTNLLSDAARRVGNQSIVVVLDVKKKRFSSKYEIYTHNGTKATGMCPVEFVKRAADVGCGEVVINSIDRDGVMKGYDLDLAEKICNGTRLPVTFLGGAGSLADISQLIERFGIIGAAAGSFFVFKGTYRAVLITYPAQEEKDKLFASLFAPSSLRE